MKNTQTRSRRKFLGKMIGAAAAASLPVAKMSSAGAVEMDSEDSWIAGVTGKHRCFFDFPQHKRGAGLVHILNYIATYRDAYGVDVSDVGTVGTLYSVGPNSSIAMGFNDDMWAKYKFGEYTGHDDPATGKPYAKNLYYEAAEGAEVPRIGPIGPFPDATVSSLQKNFGTTFLMCNNALMALSMHLSALGQGETDAIYAELKENIVPGVHLVPAMVIAIEKAQAAGITYNKQ
jgi:intracellular sulfur oxidation DsrE/DsrF family protein